MAHARTQSISTGGHGRHQSISTGGAPHSVSLKVLRLSKPSLTTSNPIPGDGILTKASLPYPSAPNDAFPLTPLLALPGAFGLAYVGTTFACTLCANTEVSSTSPTSISDVQLSADLQTPSGNTPLVLESSTSSTAAADVPPPTLQKIVRHDLREDGPHVLAVTVSYLESKKDANTNVPLKRTFRKLYQFSAQPAIGVRTKMGELALQHSSARRKFVLEAQLENLTESTVVLEGCSVNVGQGLKSRSLNVVGEKQILSPLDVVQVAFLLEQVEGMEVEEKGGRVVLAQLVVLWSAPMGERGDITTGWLGCRGR